MIVIESQLTEIQPKNFVGTQVEQDFHFLKIFHSSTVSSHLSIIKNFQKKWGGPLLVQQKSVNQLTDYSITSP